ncbi:MAG: hypothetical protein K6347_06365 [Campylobacterales bacterium]
MKRFWLVLILIIGAAAITGLLIALIVYSADNSFHQPIGWTPLQSSEIHESEGWGWFGKLTGQTETRELYPATQVEESFD